MGYDNEITVLFASDVDEWITKLDAAGCDYQVINESDYSGIQYRIVYNGYLG